MKKTTVLKIISDDLVVMVGMIFTIIALLLLCTNIIIKYILISMCAFAFTASLCSVIRMVRRCIEYELTPYEMYCTSVIPMRMKDSFVRYWLISGYDARRSSIYREFIVYKCNYIKNLECEQKVHVEVLKGTRIIDHIHVYE